MQQALLKILKAPSPRCRSRGRASTVSTDTVQIDTRGILFICGGAFVGLTDIVAKRLGARESGFGASWHDHEVPEGELLQQVCADDPG